MQFRYAYHGQSAVSSRADRTDVSLSPDTRRPATYFSGELRKSIPFREAISALHDVVVSDLRRRPKDRSDYQAWAEQRDKADWEVVLDKQITIAARLKELSAELSELEKRRVVRSSEYEKAKRRYFQYLYEKDKDAWFVLDPVITVHPDELFFECFSQDEATYGRLSADHDVFSRTGEMACGTTNIDYSEKLYDEFQKIRSYKTTRFGVDPSGFDVQTTGEANYREVKIDLPDSWVRGFLQVSSAMTLPAMTFSLHPLDIHNLCFVLRRKKEKKGPRSVRYRLTPGEPVKIVLDPWGLEIVCPRSIYEGPAKAEVRVWGRRRLLILERLLPVAKTFTVHLLGTGLPSFYVADLGDMRFTLGLSGWTANDWSTAGNFDLMAPRMQVDELTRQRVFDGLKERWFESVDSLATRLSLPNKTVYGALGGYVQAGRAIFDLAKNVYRVRELSLDPLPLAKLRFSSPQEEQASLLVDQRKVTLRSQVLDALGALHLEGSVRMGGGREAGTQVDIDGDQRIAKANCSCSFFTENKLFRGPCEHILALRMAHTRATNA